MTIKQSSPSVSLARQDGNTYVDNGDHAIKYIYLISYAFNLNLFCFMEFVRYI